MRSRPQRPLSSTVRYLFGLALHPVWRNSDVAGNERFGCVAGRRRIAIASFRSDLREGHVQSLCDGNCSVEKFEFVGTGPPVSTSLQAALKKSVSATLPRMTLTPNKDHGKPIAGWVLVVSDVDLAYLSAPDGT